MESPKVRSRCSSFDINFRVFEFCKRIIEATVDIAAAYKPNIAFFEALGDEGMKVLHRVLETIPREIPILLDSKRGDISTTAEAYATATFIHFDQRVTGVTLNAYMGTDSITPFLKFPQSGAFLLCRTSNPSANLIQSLSCIGNDGQEKLIYEEVASLAGKWNNEYSNNTSPKIGLVVGATEPEALRRVRAIVPDMWLLAPGLGAQGGDTEKACLAGLSIDGSKLLLPVSRGISKASNPREAAIQFRDMINTIRKTKQQQQKQQHLSTSSTLVKEEILSSSSNSSDMILPYQKKFIEFALQEDVLRFGSFTLKSGRLSPYFFNSGLFTTGSAISQLGMFYADAIVSSGLEFDVIFGPAYKGIPLVTATCIGLSNKYKIDKPMAFNRKEAKDHGEGGTIVGASLQGKRVLIVDDVITAGTAIRECVNLLNNVGAEPSGVVISLDRQEKLTEDSDFSAVQGVESELGLKVINIVNLTTLFKYLSTGKGENGQSKELLDRIKTYREVYGVKQ